MPFIPNAKYREIYKSSKDGNEKALAIMQALRNGASQDDLDGLVNKYYEINIPELVPQPVEEQLAEKEAPQEVETIVEENITEVPEEIDINSILDKETEGLFDENEVEGIDFNKFIENKAKNSLRSKKNSDYFKSFNPQDRTNYINSKIGNYKTKFNNNLSDIERKYNDMVISLDAYSKDVALMLDDNIDLDMNKTASCYDDLVNDKDTMHSFGRFWDENDSQIVNNKLSSLKDVYGKQNVLAALNTLKSDNEAYRDFSNNQIDQEISRYSKSVSDLLK